MHSVCLLEDEIRRQHSEMKGGGDEENHGTLGQSNLPFARKKKQKKIGLSVSRACCSNCCQEGLQPAVQRPADKKDREPDPGGV